MAQSKWDKYVTDESEDKWSKYAVEGEPLTSEIPSIPKFPTMGLQGILEDVADIPGKIPQWWEQAKSGLSGAKSQIKGYPTRAATNIIGGAVQIPFDLLNAPYELNKILGGYYKSKFGKPTRWFEKPFSGISSVMSERPIDIDVPSLLRKAAGIPGGESVGDTTLQSLVPGSIFAKQIGSQLSRLTHGKRLANLGALESKLKEAGFTHEQASKALEEIQSSSHAELGTKSPEALQYNINETLLPKIEETKNTLTKQPTLTEEPAQPMAPIEPNYPEIPEISNEEQRVKEALSKQSENVAEQEKAIKEHLGEGQIHHERFGSNIQEEQRNKYELPNKEQYSNLDKHLNEIDVSLPKEHDAAKIWQKVQDEINKGGDLQRKEINELLEQYDLAGKQQTVTARKLLGMYRTARDARLEASYDMKTNPSDEGRMAAKKRADNLKINEDELKKLLKSSIGEENRKLLSEAQTTFREKIAPLRNNTLWREISKSGKIKGNILEKLVGNEKGLSLIQDLVHNNPELMRLAVGQSYAEKPANLLKPNELLEKRYFPKMPEFNAKLQRYKNEREHLHAIENRHPEAKAKDTQSKEHAETVNDHIKLMRKEYASELKDYEKSKVERDKILDENAKEKERFEEEQKKAHKQLFELEEQVQKKKDRIKQLQQAKDKKNISLQNKVKVEKEYKEVQEDYKQKKGRVRRLIIRYGIPGFFGYEGVKHFWHQL